MANVVVLDSSQVASFIAKQIKGKGVTEHEIAEAISEIELETQTKGSSFIKVHMVDPEWAIMCSGWLDRDEEGFLPPHEVEFPQHSNMFWTLCAAEPSNELSQPNLVLTFEDRIVHILKGFWGPKRSEKGYNTRAEFIKALCIEAGVKYRIPAAEGAQDKLNKEITAVHEVQTKAEEIARNVTKAAGITAETPPGEAEAIAKSLKTTDTGKLTPKQYEFAADLASLTKLDPKVIAAWCLQEESGSAAKGRESASNNNWLNIGYFDSGPGAIAFNSAFNNPTSGAEQTAKFLKGEWGGASSGIQHILNTTKKSPAEQISAIQQSGWASSGEPDIPSIYAEISGAQAPTHAKVGTASETKEGEVSRGTTQNPSEDSWDCMVRLAGAVDYSVFTNGNILYYMSGPEMVEQKPTAWVYPKPDENKIIRYNTQGKKVTETGMLQVPLNATFDNTSVEYFATRKVKGRTQKKSRIGRPQSPSEIKVNIVCEALDYQAGDLVEFERAGPLNGRWLITDATRNCFKDKFTQLILEPPQAPLEESEEGKPAENPTVVAPLPTVAPGLSNIPGPEEGKYRDPPLTGPIGLGSFQGFQVALWIIPMLQYAQQHGWKGRITSGYRPGADPGTAGGGAGEHSKDQYPGGAVDFGGPRPSEVGNNRNEFFAACKGYTGLALIPAQFGPYGQYPEGDKGHASGTGH